MPKVETVLKGAVISAVGVLVAGYIMSKFRTVAVIETAHNGFDS